MKEKNLFTLNIKMLIKIFGIFVALIVLLLMAQRLLMPKYTGKMAEGALTGEYYESKKNHEVIFFGDSEVYYNFSPEVLNEEYGINAYIRGNANQTMWQSYYLLMDTLRYEKPKAIVVSVASLMKEEVEGEAYNRMMLDTMEWSEYKYSCIKESMTEEENVISYVFPIFRYHSRWNELSKDDFKYFFGEPNVSKDGYLARKEVVPLTRLPAVKPLSDYELSQKALEYLDKIKEICEEKDIKLVLVKSPSQYPYWYEEWDAAVVDYASKNEILYVNLLEAVDEIGLDFSVDTFDGGKHLNVDGATKNTKYFGELLRMELK